MLAATNHAVCISEALNGWDGTVSVQGYIDAALREKMTGGTQVAGFTINPSKHKLADGLPYDPSHLAGRLGGTRVSP